MHKWLFMLIVCLPMASAIAQNESQPTGVKPWQAKPVDRAEVEAVINGNLFIPDQRREPVKEPPPGTSQAQADDHQPQIVAPPSRPEDPGKQYRLIGVSKRDGQWLAFIEHRGDGTIQRVALNEPVANGQVTAINIDSIEFQAQVEVVPEPSREPEAEAGTEPDAAAQPEAEPETRTELRSIWIGQDLTGADATGSFGSSIPNGFTPGPGPSSPDQTHPDAGPGDTDNNASNASPADILRQMRERRQREGQ